MQPCDLEIKLSCLLGLCHGVGDSAILELETSILKPMCSGWLLELHCITLGIIRMLDWQILVLSLCLVNLSLVVVFSFQICIK
jgi:hypothetical protein